MLQRVLRGDERRPLEMERTFASQHRRIHSLRQDARRSVIPMTAQAGASKLDLAVVQFAGEGTAVSRYATAKDRTADAAWLHEVGFVERHHNGRLLLRGMFAGHYLDIDESDHVSQRAAGEGAVAGGLIGVLAGPPGIAVGLTVGGLLGSKASEPDEIESEPQALADQLRAAVPPSSSAVVLIAPAPEVDEMLDCLSANLDAIFRRSLTADERTALDASLDAATPKAREP
jgi:uncharacterized membrane protein